MKISLITYTYNDHEKVLELIKICRKSFTSYYEIVVIDDCSDTPFSISENDVKVIRTATNLGPGQTKRFGLSQLRGDVFLSLDADIRPSAKWLLYSLKYLTDPEVGIVGSQIIPAYTGTMLSKSLYKSHPKKKEDNQVSFLEGSLLLLRKDTWKGVGGLDDYHETTHEDIYLCRKVRNAGYKLISSNQYAVYGTRKIDYLTYVKRETRYATPVYAYEIQNYGTLKTAERICKASAPLIDFCLSTNELAGIYFEMLKISTLMLSMANSFNELLAEVPSEELTSDIFAVLNKLLDTNQRLKDTFFADLKSLGYVQPQAIFQGPSRLDIFFNNFLSLKDKKIFSDLEKNWLQAIRDEAYGNRFDFHYLS